MSILWREPRDEDERRVLYNGARSIVMGHPHYFPDSAGRQRPSVRLGLRVACSPLEASHPSTSDIRRALAQTLGTGPIGALLDDLTPTEGRQWMPWDSHGRTSFGAVLVADEDDPAPAAWARFAPAYLDYPTAWKDPRCADLVLYAEPRDRRCSPAAPVGLPRWHRRFAAFIDALGSVADQLLSGELSLHVADEPATKAAVWLNADPDLTALIDTTEVRRLPGSTTSTYFGGYAVADPAGLPAAKLATEWVRQLCDDALHLDDYEALLITSAS